MAFVGVNLTIIVPSERPACTRTASNRLLTKECWCPGWCLQPVLPDMHKPNQPCKCLCRILGSDLPTQPAFLLRTPPPRQQLNFFRRIRPLQMCMQQCGACASHAFRIRMGVRVLNGCTSACMLAIYRQKRACVPLTWGSAAASVSVCLPGATADAVCGCLAHSFYSFPVCQASHD